MILVLTLTNGKRVMFDFEDALVVEDKDDYTNITCRRDGLTWELRVKNTADNIYDMLDYEDCHED